MREILFLPLTNLAYKHPRVTEVNYEVNKFYLSNASFLLRNWHYTTIKYKNLFFKECVLLCYSIEFLYLFHFSMKILYLVRDLPIYNDHKTNNKTTLAARQQILNKKQLNYNRGTTLSI
jgi:hypothetical protein